MTRIFHATAMMGLGFVLGAAAQTMHNVAATQAATRRVESDEALKVFLNACLKEEGIGSASMESHDVQCWMNFHTTTARLAGLMLKIEFADLAISADTVKIQTTTPGQDDLNVEIHLSINVPKSDAASTFLQCLRELTENFPKQGNTIWATGLKNDRGSWELTGQCTKEQFAQDLVTRMAAIPKFHALKLATSAVDHGNILFSLTFEYAVPSATAPASAPRSETTLPTSRTP
jgi:hypothetical protein